MRYFRAVLFVFVIIAPAAWAQQPAPVRLTLREAIEKALQSNLSVRVAGAQIEEAAGTRERRWSALLPSVNGEAAPSLQNRNLRAFGISFPGLPTTVGPFSNYDFRVSATQTLIDRTATHALRASEHQQQAASLDYQDARDLVIRQAAGFYLDAESAAAEVETAEARVKTSQSLLQLAQDQHATGLATGVDILRAQVQLQRDQQNLLVRRNAYQTSLLVLARYLGMSPGSPLEPADRLEFRAAEIPDVGQALPAALRERSDYRALSAQRDALLEQLKASRARYLPRLSVGGNYGALGRNFGEMAGTGAIQATLSVTLFDRDRSGEQKELEGRMSRVQMQIADMERGIEQELRKAVLDLQSTEQQVSVTQVALDLAQREVALAEDRFRNGVSDNLELVAAQSSLQAAQDDHILALAQYADAQFALARGLGATEKNYPKYLVGK
jgi:outer membrane protein TolC